ncbi:hypothetical protein Tco_0484728 [Tanacetum coccineum]
MVVISLSNSEFPCVYSRNMEYRELRHSVSVVCRESIGQLCIWSGFLILKSVRIVTVKQSRGVSPRSMSPSRLSLWLYHLSSLSFNPVRYQSPTPEIGVSHAVTESTISTLTVGSLSALPCVMLSAYDKDNRSLNLETEVCRCSVSSD